MSFSAGCCIYESDTHSLAYGSLKEYYSMYSARYEDIVTLVKAHGEAGYVTVIIGFKQFVMPRIVAFVVVVAVRVVAVRVVPIPAQAEPAPMLPPSNVPVFFILRSLTTYLLVSQCGQAGGVFFIKAPFRLKLEFVGSLGTL